MSQRVAVLISREGCLLLIHRLKDGQEYYVFPGGGVEEGESVDEAARREALEELSLTVEVGPVLWTEQHRGRTESYLRATRFSGDVALGGPELVKQSAANQYRPVWVPFEDLAALNLVPESAKNRVLELARGGQL